MGRDSRQARRAKERRQQAQREQAERRGQTQGRGLNWSVAIGAAVILGVVLFGIYAITSGLNAKTTGPAPTAAIPTAKPAKPIDALGCNFNEQVTYHVHAHLTILDAGKNVAVPAYIGFDTNHDCLYWLHSHDSSGIIHIESPKRLIPTLGQYLDVSKKTIGKSPLPTLKKGQTMKAFVNLRPYKGNIRDIKLHPHTQITIEYGPPFKAPTAYQFPQGV
jgi:hypothetical protein